MSGRRQAGADESDDCYVVLAIFPQDVVKAHMKRHNQSLPDSLPPRVVEDAMFRPPPEGTIFRVKFSTLEVAQLFLGKARRCAYTTAGGSSVSLGAAFRKSDERRARGRACLPRHRLLRLQPRLDHSTALLGKFSARVSLAGDDGRASRLGMAQYTMLPDGTAAIRSFAVEQDAAAKHPDLIRKVLDSLSLST